MDGIPKKKPVPCVIDTIQLVLVVCLTSVTQRVRNVLDQGSEAIIR